MTNICIINGPNLNLLGVREPEIYGKKTLENIIYEINQQFPEIRFKHFQSNQEGNIIDFIQENSPKVKGLIVNLAAYTHTSIAIRDALLSVSAPIIEVHMSNIYQREQYRHKSLIADISIGQISGFKDYSYHLAVMALLNHLQ